MVPRERSTTADTSPWLRFQSPETPRPRSILEAVSGVNKQTVLGFLALLVGTAGSASPEGWFLGVPLLVAGCYLLVRQLISIPPAE